MKGEWYEQQLLQTQQIKGASAKDDKIIMRVIVYWGYTADARYHELFRVGSLASICRYNPTPESSEGAGDASVFAGNATFVAALVCDVFRGRFEGG